MIYLFLIILSIIAVALLFYLLLLLDFATTKIPFVPTPQEVVDQLVNLVPAKTDEILYDLGCGDARVLIAYAKKYRTQGIGYEKGWLAYLKSRLNVWKNKAPIKIRRKDFFKADIKNADIIFCYLYPFAMEKLEEKFQDELKIGAKVISFNFPFPNWKPEKIFKVFYKNKTEGKILVYYKL